jgi:hypothetical protein
MRTLRHCAAALAAMLALDAGATRFSDLWFNPSESGWGVNVVQQGEHAFVTLFVYGPDGEPRWYVASDARITLLSNPGALPVFEGDLYRARGPWHGGPFDPAAVRVERVGRIYLEALAADRLRVSYSAEGTSATKEVRRQTFASSEHWGSYASQFVLRTSRPGEAPVSVNRYSAEVVLQLDAGEGYMRTDDAAGNRCEYRGPYQQAGRLVNFTGTFSCSADAAVAGTFEITDLEVTTNGFTGYLRKASAGLSQYGRISGAAY